MNELGYHSALSTLEKPVRDAPWLLATERSMTLTPASQPDPIAQEVELKLELAPEDVRALRRDRHLRGGGELKRQESVYYDTRKQALRRAGFSLRVRRTGEDYVQTVKAAGNSVGYFERAEWETPIRGPLPDLEALKQTPIGAMPKLKTRLMPVMTAHIKRTTWLIEHEGGEIELVHDEGCLCAGDAELPIQELELELKSGEPAALFSLARSIAKRVPLRIGVLSKADRGLALADGTLGRMHKASAIALDKAMPITAAFPAIISACVRHFRLNEQAIVERRDALALHQARVAVRRLRSALSLFSPIVRDPALGPLREELRWLGGVLGEARNLDVFLKTYKDVLSSADQEKVEAARSRAYDRVLRALRSKRLRDLFLDLLAWTATGEWRGGARATARIDDFSAKRLQRLWRKLQSGAEQLHQLDQEQLHRFRIHIKKFRYAVEFLGSLYRTRDARPFTESLESLQERLGELNDGAIAHQIIAKLSVQLPSQDADTAGQDRSKGLARLRKPLERLKRIGRFWAKGIERRRRGADHILLRSGAI